MIKALWFFTKVAILATGSIWLISQPGDLAFSFLGYSVRAQTGVFIIVLIAFILITFYLLQFVRSVLRTPQKISEHKQSYDQKIGYLSLTRGLVAVASGDSAKANQYAQKANKLLKGDNGLPLLLKAQAAHLNGQDDVANACYEELSTNKETAFLGVRGLMKAALEQGNETKALEYAKQGLKTQPHHPSLLKMVYNLSLKNQTWDEALKISSQLQKIKGQSVEKLNSDRIAIYLHRYDQSSQQAFGELKAAYKLNSVFVPTVKRLVEHYMKLNKRRKAVSLIEATWKESPHPDLADMWMQLAPPQKKDANTKKLAWANKLVEMNPDSVQSQIAAAKMAIELEYWGEAKAYLMVAENIYATAQVFHLRALAEKNITQSEDQVESLLAKASNAMPAKVWVCAQTGLTYDDWSAIAMPHESFNTIIWDVPGARVVMQDNAALLPQNDVMRLIDPAA
jgi:HemY protein